MQSHQYCQQESRGNQLRNQAKPYTFGRSENRDSQKRALWKFDIAIKNNITALIKFYTLGKRWYNFRNAYNKYSLTDRRINAIESIYICDISSTTAHKIAGFYKTFPGLNETI